jgi:hypothetical protein
MKPGFGMKHATGSRSMSMMVQPSKEKHKVKLSAIEGSGIPKHDLLQSQSLPVLSPIKRKEDLLGATDNERGEGEAVDDKNKDNIKKVKVTASTPEYLLHESLAIDGVHVIIKVFAKGKFLIFSAYDPASSSTHEAQLGVNDVKMLLSHRHDLFRADMRKDLCKALTDYLHFTKMNGQRYPTLLLMTIPLNLSFQLTTRLSILSPC